MIPLKLNVSWTIVDSLDYSILILQKKYLTLFFPLFPFDPPENIRKPKVFWCFQGDQKGTLGRKGLRVRKYKNEFKKEIACRYHILSAENKPWIYFYRSRCLHDSHTILAIRIACHRRESAPVREFYKEQHKNLLSLDAEKSIWWVYNTAKTEVEKSVSHIQNYIQKTNISKCLVWDLILCYEAWSIDILNVLKFIKTKSDIDQYKGLFFMILHKSF